MSTIPLCKHRYIGLRNSCWAEISVFLMVIHDCSGRNRLLDLCGKAQVQSRRPVLVSPAWFKRKQFARATYPTRSCSAYPAPVHLCIVSLLHRLISYQWCQVHPQSLCQQQGCLSWFLPCCVLMWLQCMKRTWHFFAQVMCNPAQVAQL